MVKCRPLRSEERRVLRRILDKSRSRDREFAGQLNGKPTYYEYEAREAVCPMGKIVYHTHQDPDMAYFSPTDVVTTVRCGPITTMMVVSPDGYGTMVKPDLYYAELPLPAADIMHNPGGELHKLTQEELAIARKVERRFPDASVMNQMRKFRAKWNAFIADRYNLKVKHYTYKATDVEVCK
jgi:hypothetical protein